MRVHVTKSDQTGVYGHPLSLCYMGPLGPASGDDCTENPLRLAALEQHYPTLDPLTVDPGDVCSVPDEGQRGELALDIPKPGGLK